MAMCAIAGVIGLKTEETTVLKMLETMRRRGPDGEGVCSGSNWCLLHTRLAIIDLDRGKQPMSLRWGEKNYTLVYNGEMYNMDEIRCLLLKEGHRFLGHSDTELVLHAFAQWGESCVEKINGIFAFAVWEEQSGMLFLARDRIGVKPLFYTIQDGGLIFASEIKTILQYPSVKPVLDQQGVMEVIMLGPGRVPGSGVFHGIRELEPGCCGYLCNGKLSTKRYWKLTDRDHLDDFETTKERVRSLVTDSILRQTVSDVPLGTFLSGGLDSSLITAICAREYERKGDILKSFSVDYKDNARYFTPGKFQPNADPHYVELIKNDISTSHKWTILAPEELEAALEDSTIARDLPGMADVDFSLLCFCREIRKDVKVVLSGECADEIFGGYPWYRDPEVRMRAGFPWAQNTLQRGGMLTEAVTTGCNPQDFVTEQYTKTCQESDILPGVSEQERRMKEMMNLNFRWFMQTLLDRKDRMSMFSGLEVRVPFCDYRIAEYLYGVPWEFKDYQGKEKGLLRAAMTGILPEEVLWRKKSPYPKTFDPRYTALIRKRFELLLRDQSSPLFYMITRQGASSVLEDDSPWPWYGQLMRLPQTMAFLLQIDFWLRKYQINYTF